MAEMRSSYIAAAVPNSGGEVTRQTIQDPSRVPAVMTMHGGASDMVIVSFATTSATYDAQIKAAGGFVVNCNHGGGHCQAPAALYAAGWEFMKAHPFGVDPEPYSSGLPRRNQEIQACPISNRAFIRASHAHKCPEGQICDAVESSFGNVWRATGYCES
jgi:hypothetical protein